MSVAVFVLTYAAAWVSLGTVTQMGRLTAHAHFLASTMQRIIGSLEDYAKAEGSYPDSLESLQVLDSWILPENNPNISYGELQETRDPWNRPYQYERTAKGFRLYSLGRDGRVGGIGLDADIHHDDILSFHERRLPLRQFLFEAHNSPMLFIVASLASLFAGGIVSWGSKQRAIEDPDYRVSAGSILAVTLTSVFIAANLAALYVYTSNSSH